GENVVTTVPDIGYLHTGIEKTAETLNFNQALTLTDRMDYLSPQGNNLAYSLATERLMGIEVPERAQIIRVIMAELTRIQSHLVWLGTHALDLGAMSAFFYCFRERDQILDMFETNAGVRMMTSYICPGGLREDLAPEVIPMLERFLKIFPEKLGEYEGLLSKNPIWLERTQGVGKISVADALAYGMSGPSLRGSGIAWDMRKIEPYSGYEEYEFAVPTGTQGDVYDRYLCRIEEMRQSQGIIKQAIARLQPGSVQVDDRKLVTPPKAEIGNSMESLIHHFLISTIGFTAPNGEGHVPTESPRGLLSFYVVGDGSPKPYRMRARTPSFNNLQALPIMMRGSLIADAVATIGSIDIVLGEIDR
ncbi:MAG: NADH dehydrogenase (quinone) subunit D, partial [Armatimonadota bacterium]